MLDSGRPLDGQQDVTEFRLRLRRGGYDPLPLEGKAPSVMKEWQHKFDVSEAEIVLWGKLYDRATNTGILTRTTPTLDIDVTLPEAAEAVEELARERFEERGYVLTRIGNPPKRAIPFRTDEPFAKIAIALVSPDGTNHKLEFLGDGQQVVVAGVHPDTHKPYIWHGGVAPGEIERKDLPYITGAEAQKFVDDATDLLVRDFGFARPVGAKKADGEQADTGERVDWDVLIGNLLDGTSLHDSLRDLAASCVAKGYNDADTTDLLRALMRKSRASRDDRWLDRYNSITGLVRSAREKFGKGEADQQQQAEFTSLSNDTAFGYSWQWLWHGEADPIDSRRWLVDPLLPETGVGLISGQWGTFKTFVAFDLAAAVMSEGTFIKFPVRRRGGVLFFACEGQSEVAIRLAAVLEAKCSDLKSAPFAWVLDCPQLLEPNAAKILAAMIKHAGERMMREFGLPVALVIIDTAGRAAGYGKSGDENDVALAKIIMKSLMAASAETGTLILGVDHFGKRVETGTRGSSSKEDDADVVLALLGEKGVNGVVANTRLCARKRRSGPNGEEFPFRTKVAEMGADENGTAVTTLTIEWVSKPEGSTTQAKPKDAWSKPLRHLRQAMMNMLAEFGSEQRPFPDGSVVRAVDLELVRAEFHNSYPATGDQRAKTDARRKAFNRAVKDAGAKGLIGTRDVGAITYVWLAGPHESA